MKIATRLLLLFLMVSVLPLLLFSYVNLQQDELTLRTEVLGRMSGLADKKVIQLKSYLAERVREVRIRVRGPQVIAGMDRLPKLYAAGRTRPAYLQESAALHQYFDRYVEDSGRYYDVFLITPQGEIVYTQKHESDFASNLLTGAERDSQLAQAFRTVSMTLEPVISGYAQYTPSHAPALFIAAPIMVEGQFKGVFAAQLGNDLFYQVATDATGLGRTGEAAFAQREGENVLYTTPLKYHADAAMKLRLSAHAIQSTPMFGALLGESGAGVKQDYRGKSVAAAWRYLPELAWGMVVKIDTDEAFASIAQQRARLLKVLLGLLLFAGLVGYDFGRQISVPLDTLARTVDEMAEGNLDKRADESAPGELGMFARAFNRMTDSLQILHRAERVRAAAEIHHLAFYDVLTRLPNRRLVLDRAQLALSLSVRSHHCGAVLLLDMDKFKTVNDTLGHEYGDLMLVEVGRRIQTCVQGVDTVGRLGGDEFSVLVEEMSPDIEEASQKIALIAEKIRTELIQPYRIKGRIVHCSPSIGVAMYCDQTESVETLMKHADMAMYQAKEAGRNVIRFFDPLMQQRVEAHAELEADLRSALQNQQLHLYYQIQVDSDHRPLGAEALIRWIHPQRGMVSPAQFVPVAEESTLILDIGCWVIETACRQLAAWTADAQLRSLVLAVNVSAQQFKQPDFVERLATVIIKNGIAPARLKLELTESVVLDDVADVVEKMHALKTLGVGLSLDDFGTGYSSLTYLKRLPLDQIKIDQSFVRDITTDANDAVMVKTIIDMAQNFRLNVIAEGVETEAQLAFLKQNGCMAYQGYLFSRPVPVAEFEKLVRDDLLAT